MSRLHKFVHLAIATEIRVPQKCVPNHKNNRKITSETCRETTAHPINLKIETSRHRWRHEHLQYVSTGHKAKRNESSLLIGRVRIGRLDITEWTVTAAPDKCQQRNFSINSKRRIAFVALSANTRRTRICIWLQLLGFQTQDETEKKESVPRINLR